MDDPPVGAKPRRKRSDMSAETMQALIAAARRSFARVGYANTSMDALCAEAGLTRGALYHHFGGKDGLLEAVVRQIDKELGARVDAACAHHHDPYEAFKACCLTYLDLTLEPEIQQIVLRDAPAVLGPRLREIDADGSIGPITQALEALMAQGVIEAVDAEALARLLNGAMIDAALWIAASADPAAASKRTAGAFGLLLDGLLRRPTG